MPSMEMNLSTASLRKRDEACEAREDQVEQHAHDPNEKDCRYDICNRKIIPLIPHEVADAGAADEHFGRDDHQPRDTDGDAHAGEDRGRGGWQDDREGAAQRPDLKGTRDIEPFLAYRCYA